MSCLFIAIGSLLQIDPTELRQNVCNYLSSNPVIFDDGTRVSQAIEWESNQSAQEYIKQMRLTSTWGGSPEIKSVCNMYGCNIHVHDIRSSPAKTITFYPSNKRSKYALHLAWSGNHFTTIDHKEKNVLS